MSDDNVHFMRLDLADLQGEGTYFYRLDDGLHEFIEKVEKSTGKEVAVITLERKGFADYGRSIGFVVAEREA